MHLINKYIAAPFILSLSVLMLQGCATAVLLTSGSSSSQYRDQQVIYTDQVSTFFTYEILNSTSPNQQNLPIETDGIAFEGEKHIYFLIDGKEEILALNKKLDNIQVNICDGNIQPVEYFEPKDNLTNGSFYQDFCLTVGNINLTTKQRQIIDQLGFYLENEKFIKKFVIKGVIINKQSINVNKTQESSLQHLYPIEFYSITNKTSIHYGTIAKKVLLAPVAISLDILTAPLQIYVYYLLSNNIIR